MFYIMILLWGLGEDQKKEGYGSIDDVFVYFNIKSGLELEFRCANFKGKTKYPKVNWESKW